MDEVLTKHHHWHILNTISGEVTSVQHNKKLTTLAQKLRRNMTKEEKQLWYHFLREYPVQFRRQVTCGNYILDFYCAKAKLAIEIDGSQHFEPESILHDQDRTNYLNSIGIFVLRIPNNEIWRNLDGVCDAVEELIVARIGSKPHPSKPGSV